MKNALMIAIVFEFKFKLPFSVIHIRLFHLSFFFFCSIVSFLFSFDLWDIGKFIQESDGEKSDQDLVVDVANEMVSIVSLTKSKIRNENTITKQNQNYRTVLIE